MFSWIKGGVAGGDDLGKSTCANSSELVNGCYTPRANRRDCNMVEERSDEEVRT